LRPTPPRSDRGCPADRRDPLGHLVHVGLGREAAAEVEELPYAAFGSHVMHHPADEGPVIPDDSRHVRRHRLKLLRRLPVDGEIVLAAEQVIVNPGHIRPGYIDTVRRRVLRRHLRRHSRFAMDAIRDSAYAWGPCAMQ
jgi:hypothetical protein